MALIMKRSPCRDSTSSRNQKSSTTSQGTRNAAQHLIIRDTLKLVVGAKEPPEVEPLLPTKI